MMTPRTLTSLLCAAVAVRSTLAMRSPCAGKSGCDAKTAALASALSADMSASEGVSLLQVRAQKKNGTSETKVRRSESRRVRPKKDARIAIVGAGPAGVHMAMELKKLGYTNVTLLELSDRVGGRAFTLYRDAEGKPCNQTKDSDTGRKRTDECIAHDMGASRLHSGYHTVRALVKEYGLAPEVSPPEPAILSDLAPCTSCGMTASEFVGAGIMKKVHAGAIQIPKWVPNSTGLVTAYALVDAAARYIALSQEIYGDVEFTLPERLSLDKIARIDMSFRQFLEKNRLHALDELLTLAHTAQGYGYLSSVHAFYGLVWVTPEVVNGLVQKMLHEVRQRWMGAGNTSNMMKLFVHKAAKYLVGGAATGVEQPTTMLPEGFQTLWQRIVEQDGLKVTLNANIVNFGIDRQLDYPTEPIRISREVEGEKWPLVEEYDELIYAAPLRDATMSFLDITDEEREIFGDLKMSSLVTTLYSSDSAPKGSLYDTRVLMNKTGEGHLFHDRSDEQIFGSGQHERAPLRVAVQFYESGSCGYHDPICKRRHAVGSEGFKDEVASASAELEEDLRARGATDVQILQQFAWPFFPRLSRKGIRKGYIWDIMDLQGHQKTWWIGAGTSFDSVHDVVNYNNMLLKRHFGAQVTGDGARRKEAHGVSF